MGNSTNLSGQTLIGTATYPVRSGFGYRSSGSEETHLDGSVDEIRISDTYRPAGWISTGYNNQDNPSAFHSTASENSSVPVLDLSGQNLTVTGTFENNGTLKLEGGETVNLTMDTNSGIVEY